MRELYVKEFYNQLGVFCGETITDKNEDNCVPLALTLEDAFKRLGKTDFYFWSKDKKLVHVYSDSNLLPKNAPQLLQKMMLEFPRGISLRKAIQMQQEYRKSIK